jgi:hypothetical protein
MLLLKATLSFCESSTAFATFDLVFGSQTAIGLRIPDTEFTGAIDGFINRL